MKSSSQLRFFFPDNSSLYEVDKTKPNKQTETSSIQTMLAPPKQELLKMVDLMKQLTTPSSYFKFHHYQGRSRIEEVPQWVGATAEQAWGPKFESSSAMWNVRCGYTCTYHPRAVRVRGRRISVACWLLTIGVAPDSVRDPDLSEQDRE